MFYFVLFIFVGVLVLLFLYSVSGSCFEIPVRGIIFGLLFLVSCLYLFFVFPFRFLFWDPVLDSCFGLS